MLKFHIDGAARGKLRPAGVGEGVLLMRRVVILHMFSKSVGAKDSSEAKVLVILEALQIFSRCLHPQGWGFISWSSSCPLQVMRFFLQEILSEFVLLLFLLLV